MQFKDTNCCGVKEIWSLSAHRSPELAMDEFCKYHLGTIRNVTYHGMKARPQTIYSFYLFTAAIMKSCLGNYPATYGPDFANFIRLNKLGTVTRTRAVFNLAFHPDHKVQAWLWCPNVKRLQKWWEDRSAKALADKAQAVARASLLEQGLVIGEDYAKAF